jgi:two-component system, OmpR family, response regulator
MAARQVVALLCIEANLAGALGPYLERHGCAVHRADTPWEAESLLAAGGIDLALVGSGASAEDGLDLVRRHAGSGTGLVVLATRADVLSKVLALELGAADVVDDTTPLREITARIRGILARHGHRPAELLLLENCAVDMRAALVMHRNGSEDMLSPGQVALLRLFAERPGIVLSRDDIIAAAPAETADAFDRSIDSRIVRLRRRLETDSIVTVRGLGYRFDPPAQAVEPPAG